MQTTSINHKNIYYPPGGILLWIIIFLELLTFGMALVALVYYSRSAQLEYHNSRLLLNTTYGALNTVFLLSSGFFMATSVHQLKQNQPQKAQFFLKLTMLGGWLFLILKGVEYYDKMEAGLTIGYNLFFTFYWMLTLFHVIHVMVGLGVLSAIARGVRKGTSDLVDVEAGAAFWHMCDLIWLLLFPVLYLML